MKKITFLFLLFFSVTAFAQFPESFETTVPPTGWVTFRGANGLGTLYDWTATTVPENVSDGTQAAFVRYENVDGGLAEDWLVSPAHTVTAPNTSLSFFQRQTFTADYGTQYTIRVSTTSQTDISSFAVVNTQSEADLGVVMSEKLVDLSAYVGQSIYIAFVMTNDDGDNWAVDNVNMVTSVSIPDCSAVVFPLDNAVDVPVGTVIFEWEAPTTGGEATAYDLFYGVEPDDVNELLGTFTTTSTEVGIADYGFTFYWRIVPKNGAGGATDCPVWSFTTQDSPGFCLASVYGQWPGGAAYTPEECDGVAPNIITEGGYASEYSLVNLVEGETYQFTSGTTDFVTISTDDGQTAAAFGDSPLTWVSNFTGVARFYSHVNDQCESEGVNRTRSIICGETSADTPDYANLQFPSSATVAQGESTIVYAQIYHAGLTDVEPGLSGQAEGIQAWIGVSPLGQNTNPNTWTTWIVATHNAAQISNNDEYQASIGGDLAPGTYYYASRFRLNDGAYVYGGLNANDEGSFWNGTDYLSGVLTVSPPPVPENDECSGAIALEVGGTFEINPLTATNLGSTSDTLVATCQENVANNVWFMVEVPDSGNVTIETQTNNSDYSDSVIEVFSGDCGALVPVPDGCNDDSPEGGLFSLVSLTNQTPGATLYVSVWRFSFLGSGSDGTFNISAYDASLSTGSFDNAGFKYYPNPVKDVLNLNYSSSISNVVITNLLGQQVLAKNINSNESQLDLSTLSAGAYLVKITTEDNLEKTIKVIKQ